MMSSGIAGITDNWNAKNELILCLIPYTFLLKTKVAPFLSRGRYTGLPILTLLEFNVAQQAFNITPM